MAIFDSRQDQFINVRDPICRRAVTSIDVNCVTAEIIPFSIRDLIDTNRGANGYRKCRYILTAFRKVSSSPCAE